MLTLAALAAVAHVPIYPDGHSYQLDRNASISQVIYFPHGSGNVQVPAEHLAYSNNSAHVDVIIRDKDDAAHYAIYTQCGSGTDVFRCCPAGVSSPNGVACDKDPCSVKGEGHLEPFTQTSYFSLLDEWTSIDCPSGALTIRAVRHSDETFTSDHPRGPAAIVIGRGEEFTFGELMSIGHYALLNHGAWWNEAGWTYWVFLTLVAAIVVVTCKMTESYGMKTPTVFEDKPRELFYWFAIVGFGAAFLETTTHTGIAQAPVAASGELGIAILIILLNLVFMGVILLNMYLDMDWIQSPVWAPLELGTAFSCFLLFGVGYYVAPSFWMCAALVRMYRLVSGAGSSNSLFS